MVLGGDVRRKALPARDEGFMTVTVTLTVVAAAAPFADAVQLFHAGRRILRAKSTVLLQTLT